MLKVRYVTFCTLEMAGRVVLRSEGGFPEAEYALFEPDEIELRAIDLGAIREAGYRTTATEALERLAGLGITPQASEEAALVLRGPAERLYSRGVAVERALPLLGPAELFDGYVYDVENQAYEGLWIDHAAVARDLGVGAAGAILQAMGLAAMLDECPPESEVVLTTIHMMKERRAGERSYRRTSFRDAAQIAEAIGNLAGAPSNREPRRARSVLELVQSLRERPIEAERFRKIEQALASAKPPPRGPLADPEIWSIDAALTAGELQGAVARIEAVEKAHGRQPATIYLRCRASLLLGTEAPRAIGERLAQLALSHAFPELEVLAAQAWLAAGESSRALPFARSIAENPAAPLKLREIAEDIVAAVPRPGASNPPSAGARRTVRPSLAAPSLAPPSLAPSASDRPGSSALDWDDVHAPEPAARVLMKGASRPAFRFDQPPPSVPRAAPLPRFESPRPELAETLSLPPGLHEQMAPEDRIPATVMEARVQFTHLARELGRDYRVRFGIELWTDLSGIETMQTLVREEFKGRVTVEANEAIAVRRYGAFLSEVLARMLGAEWVDIAASEPGHWAMLVPPSTRVWPFGRVLRFIAMGTKERDLVSYCLELEARGRAH